MKYAHWRDDTKRSRYPPLSSAVRQSVGDGFQTQASKAFGDFFLRGHLEEPLANHARDFSVSEGFQVESEVLMRRKNEKAAFRKLDRRILPLLSLFTFCLYLDPKNMLNLRMLDSTGLQTSLDLSDEQYLLGVTAKHLACIATALPWNLVLGKVGGGTQLPLLLMVWGGITLSHAFLDRGFGGLLAARISLGIVEGGILPGLILYLATFYTRAQLQLRIALVFSAACVSSALSDLLSNYITRMNGILDLHGWSWVFMLEGVMAFIFGFIAIFFLPSTILKCKFLNREQKETVLSRLKHEGRNLENAASVPSNHVLAALFKSPHVLLISLCAFLSGATTQSLLYFQPQVVDQLGLNPTHTLLASMPPYSVAIIFMLFTSFISDRYASRGMSVILSATMLMCGFMMCMVFEEKYQQYGMLYIEIPGAFALAPALGAWLANNSEPYARCASSIAMGFMFANGGTILTIWLIYLYKSPGYHAMTPIYIGISIGMMLLAAFTWAWLAYQNRTKTRNRDRLLASYQASKISVDARKGPCQILFLIGWERLGDKHPDFTYSY